MTLKTAIVLTVLVGFGVLSGYAIVQHGYWGIIAYHLPSSAGWQVAVDLVIACSLASLWMYFNARATGRNPWPYLLLTLVGGSFGPLLYLLIGELARSKHSPDPGMLRSHG